ncbi:hypothetical protein [Moorena producens]|uniref:hypothetical protein n=1 Tax=Moorena producens TaxID=1155739 RepID=UPI003C71787C
MPAFLSWELGSLTGESISQLGSIPVPLHLNASDFGGWGILFPWPTATLREQTPQFDKTLPLATLSIIFYKIFQNML